MARKQTSAAVAGPTGVLGQLEEARRRLVAFERELVKRGRAQQREIESMLKGIRTGKQVKLIERQAAAAGTEVKRRLDGLQDQVLGVLGVASRADIAEINRELTKLTKKIDQLATKRASAGA